ncbi:hypothetical protein Cgig2_000146 [Carnegiea gigantea]|uniref:Uncharacterized protein n=1 Tax=Carnegiea gigantea TaxID=171969 RepID=A0A9Q1KZD8_9CARY|nr:hypothetical protein Cgig2_000146 [Carnegiea gigantea]
MYNMQENQRDHQDQAIANLLTQASIVGSYGEMVDCLDKIMSWAIIGATFIIWLLLTRLASTRILVIIATPLVAASFIFGDTCKNLFQGIVFVYAIRPFSVGDECDIGEDSPLRVTSIGVWKTIFSKTIKGRQVKVKYPNSELANKRVLINREFLGEQETMGNDESKSDKTAPEESNKPAVPEAPISNKPAAPDDEGSNNLAAQDHEGSSKPAAPDHERTKQASSARPRTAELTLQHSTSSPSCDLEMPWNPTLQQCQTWNFLVISLLSFFQTFLYCLQYFHKRQ